LKNELGREIEAEEKLAQILREKKEFEEELEKVFWAHLLFSLSLSLSLSLYSSSISLFFANHTLHRLGILELKVGESLLPPE
jgi:hypothetical protein